MRITLRRTGATFASVLILGFALIVSGCGSFTNANTAADIMRRNLDADEGIVFASLVQQDARVSYNIIRFRFRNVDTGKTGALSIAPGLPGTSTRTIGDDARGNIESVTLPAGKYEFYNFLLVEGRSRWTADEDFSILFKVYGERAVYLGEIRLVPSVGRAYLGLPKAEGGHFVISSNRERDISLFRHLYPNLNKSDIVAIPIRGGDAPPNIVTFR